MLSHKIALVTGASRGIGKAIALTLGRQNATVIGTATHDEGATKIHNLFKQENINGTGTVLNVNESLHVKHVLDYISEQYGNVDILVNNAGITRDNLLMLMKDEQWDEVINTDLTSVFRLSKAVLRPMIKKRWGRIISITSVVGAMGNSGQSNYAAAKAGIIGFNKSLAREVASRNITVNTIAPGFIQTDMTDSLNDVQKQNLASNIPLGRLGKTNDVAAAALFLAAASGDYITGQTLHVNGGMYMG